MNDNSEIYEISNLMLKEKTHNFQKCNQLKNVNIIDKIHLQP